MHTLDIRWLSLLSSVALALFAASAAAERALADPSTSASLAWNAPISATNGPARGPDWDEAVRAWDEFGQDLAADHLVHSAEGLKALRRYATPPGAMERSVSRVSRLIVSRYRVTLRGP